MCTRVPRLVRLTAVGQNRRGAAVEVVAPWGWGERHYNAIDQIDVDRHLDCAAGAPTLEFQQHDAGHPFGPS
jgi:hypothetical protein